MRTKVLLIAAVVLAACQKAETPEQASDRMTAESDSLKTAITALNADWARHLNANHADSAAMIFMEDGVMMPPNKPAVVGRAAITADMTANPMPPGSTIAFTTVDVAANGSLAIERGTYSFSMPAMGRTPASTTAGKYLTHWHKVNGQWLVASDIWSDDVPAPPMAGN